MLWLVHPCSHVLAGDSIFGPPAATSASLSVVLISSPPPRLSGEQQDGQDNRDELLHGVSFPFSDSQISAKASAEAVTV